MIGGMGNQMFQYALYRKFLEMNIECKYEISRTGDFHEGFVLKHVFDIIENQSTIKEANSLNRFQEQTWPTFNPEILEKRDSYICGNWQNVGYFPNEKDLRNDFTFKNELDDKNLKILNEIKESNSVSLHIRKGDYTNAAHTNYFFQADWMNYYGMATGAIMKNIKNRPKFFIFSDDIAWAKQNTFAPDSVFIESNRGFDSWKDMMLMSNCKHNITANSTFSWWGAWLNTNPDKIVTTPKSWFKDNVTNSNLITLPEWIKI